MYVFCLLITKHSNPSRVLADSIKPSLDIQPPSFAATFKRRSDEEEPSLLGNTFSGQQLTEFMLTIKPEQLKDLKQLWHIPDYDFPLDTASRPGYTPDVAAWTSRKSCLRGGCMTLCLVQLALLLQIWLDAVYTSGWFRTLYINVVPVCLSTFHPETKNTSWIMFGIKSAYCKALFW